LIYCEKILISRVFLTLFNIVEKAQEANKTKGFVTEISSGVTFTGRCG
jgi:hypothetical protein